MLNHNGGPTKLPAKGGGQQQRPGKEEPLVGWRKEGASDHHQSWSQFLVGFFHPVWWQGCISCGTCSYPELTEDHVLTSAYVKIFRIVTRNAVNKSVWRKKDCFWLPLNKHAVNIWLSSLRIRAHLSWRTGKHLHVLHVLRTYPTCSYPGYQDTTTYAALPFWRLSVT